VIAKIQQQTGQSCAEYTTNTSFSAESTHYKLSRDPAQNGGHHNTQQNAPPDRVSEFKGGMGSDMQGPRDGMGELPIQHIEQGDSDGRQCQQSINASALSTRWVAG